MSCINSGFSFSHKPHSVFSQKINASKISRRSTILHAQQPHVHKKHWAVWNVVLITVTASSHRSLFREGILIHWKKWLAYGKETSHFATTAFKQADSSFLQANTDKWLQFSQVAFKTWVYFQFSQKWPCVTLVLASPPQSANYCSIISRRT